MSHKNKFSHKSVKEFIETESKCKLLSNQYIGCYELLKLKCKCGNVFQSSFNNFKHSNKRQCNDCGLENNITKQSKDMTGLQFGRLTVLHQDKEYKGRGLYWVCKCSCKDKNTISISTSGLKGRYNREGTKSCGCLVKEISSRLNKLYNSYEFIDDYVIMRSKDGFEMYIDSDDYKRVSRFYWNVRSTGYPIATDSLSGSYREIKLHRLIMDAKDGDILDHINRNRLDNRKSNLRFVTATQNCINITRRKDNTSGVTGVYYHTRDNVWTSNISIDKKQKCLGSFARYEDAVISRLTAEVEHYGEYSSQKDLIKDYLGIDLYKDSSILNQAK